MGFSFAVTMPGEETIKFSGARIDVLRECGTSVIYENNCQDIPVAIIPREALIVITVTKED